MFEKRVRGGVFFFACDFTAREPFGFTIEWVRLLLLPIRLKLCVAFVFAVAFVLARGIVDGRSELAPLPTERDVGRSAVTPAAVAATCVGSTVVAAVGTHSAAREENDADFDTAAVRGLVRL